MVRCISPLRNVFHARFLRLGFCCTAAALLSASSCFTSPDEEECGISTSNALSLSNTPQALGSPDLETSLNGGVRTFSWSRLVQNVCSSEHVKAGWLLNVDAVLLPPGWHVEAGYLITQLSGSVVPLTESTLSGTTTREYRGNSDIGLKQAFEGQPGRFLIFLDFSFNSLGSLTDDREAVNRFFHNLIVVANYKEHPAD